MHNLKRVLITALVFVLGMAILVFILENQQSVSLLFLGWEGPHLPLSVIALAALLTGMLIGPLMAWVMRRNVRMRQSRGS